ncbi:hypothetical protein B0H34DRAFT_736604 [Crassisporium funariophilum]|nr:hypothetical protein B0H34DRAFT_736604 [Crassisporium funariophilum]
MTCAFRNAWNHCIKSLKQLHRRPRMYKYLYEIMRELGTYLGCYNVRDQSFGNNGH